MRLLCPTCQSENQFRPVSLDPDFIVACKNCDEELELVLKSTSEPNISETLSADQSAQRVSTSSTTQFVASEKTDPPARPTAAQTIDPPKFETAQANLTTPQRPLEEISKKIDEISKKFDQTEEPQVQSDPMKVTQQADALIESLMTQTPENEDEYGKLTTQEDEKIEVAPGMRGNADLVNALRNRQKETEDLTKANKKSKPKAEKPARAKGEKSKVQELRGAILGGLIAAGVGYSVLNPATIIGVVPALEPIYANLGLIAADGSIILDDVSVDTSSIESGVISVEGIVANNGQFAEELPEIEVTFHSDKGAVADRFPANETGFIEPAEVVNFARQIPVPQGEFDNVSVRLAIPSEPLERMEQPKKLDEMVPELSDDRPSAATN